MTEIEAEVIEEEKTEVKVQAMHFETEAMHRGPSIVDHGPKMWQVNRRPSLGRTIWSQFTRCQRIETSDNHKRSQVTSDDRRSQNR
jgi:hypothetical protein